MQGIFFEKIWWSDFHKTIEKQRQNRAYCVRANAPTPSAVSGGRPQVPPPTPCGSSPCPTRPAGAGRLRPSGLRRYSHATRETIAPCFACFVGIRPSNFFGKNSTYRLSLLLAPCAITTLDIKYIFFNSYLVKMLYLGYHGLHQNIFFFFLNTCLEHIPVQFVAKLKTWKKS